MLPIAAGRARHREQTKGAGKQKEKKNRLAPNKGALIQAI